MGTYILNKKQVINFKLNPNDYNVLIRITSPKTEFISFSIRNLAITNNFPKQSNIFKIMSELYN